ncbi:MAG: response regulator [Eubacteriales bacterium]
MWHILIADDEKMTRIGLESMLVKHFPNQIECVQAENGMQALKLVKANRFDLAIVDINMPFITGIQFIEEITRLELDIPVIIVSGYQEFSYAQQALRLGVIDYITKPFQTDILVNKIEVVLSAHRKHSELEVVEAESSPATAEKYKQSLLVQLINKNISESVIKELKSEHILGSHLFKKMLCIYYQIEKQEQKKVDINQVAEIIYRIEKIFKEILKDYSTVESFVFTYSKGCVGVLLESDFNDQIDAVLEQLKKKKRWDDEVIAYNYCIGIGETVNEWTGVTSSFEQSLLAADNKIFAQESGMYYYKKNIVELLEYYPFTFSKEELTKTLSKILIIHDEEKKIAVLRWFYTLLLNKMHSQDVALSKSRNFHHYWNLYELKHELESNIDIITADSISSANQLDILESVIYYIQSNLRRELDINHIALEFKKSPGYLGMIFKKKYQISINEYITKERMQLAKNLLQNSDMNINEISTYCGYNSPKYFAVSFKKAEGISPTQFKQLYKKGERVHLS